MKRARSISMSEDDINIGDVEDDEIGIIPLSRRSSLSRSYSSSLASPRNCRSPRTVLSRNATVPSLEKVNVGQVEDTLNYHRVHISDIPLSLLAGGDDASDIGNKIGEALALRRKFIRYFDDEKERESTVVQVDAHGHVHTVPFEKPSSHLPAKSLHTFKMSALGIMEVFEGEKDGEGTGQGKMLTDVPSWKEFDEAFNRIMVIVQDDGACRSFAHKRLEILQARFNLHRLLNNEHEARSQKSISHRDFYNVRKIDNHVHHSACMNQKHLLRFIKHKMKTEPNVQALSRDGAVLTLSEVFESLNISPYDLSVDVLDMHAQDSYHRFDRFNLKYNPIGESRLREIFLKYNNFMKGRFLAELTRQVFDDLESTKYQLAEYRLSIYGLHKGEWDALAKWTVDHNLFSEANRWMIQIPRLYAVYRASGKIQNFQDLLSNIFTALFEVTVDPSSHPELHMFLQQCVGFDCVDDESGREKPNLDSSVPPSEWTGMDNPPYHVFNYYIYANLLSLNQLRHARGMTTFKFRPHSGEAGDISHLASTFLVAHQINHGLVLKRCPALQYLFYLAQIGISMSPLSNNLLFVEYENNPFPLFFARGLNATLSTDDPLMIHVTKEPLVEEYSVAAQVWKLSPVDVCEIARNSVLQSGFEHKYKTHWLGRHYYKRSLDGNDIRQTNVPKIRIAFRLELLDKEYEVLSKMSGKSLTAKQYADRN